MNKATRALSDNGLNELGTTAERCKLDAAAFTSSPTLAPSRLRPSLLIVPILFASLSMIYGSMLGLSADEAYYWTWSRRLAGGYFDHGPLVAWLIAASTALLGTSELTVRLPAALLGAASLIVATQILLECGIQQTSRLLLGQLALALLPLVQLLAWIITPDTPATFFTLVALLAALAAHRTGRLLPCVVLGASLGLAMLSKYVALIPAGIILGYLATVSRRHLCLSIVAGLIALAVLSPMLLWNIQHDWVSFRFQFHHGFSTAARPWYINLPEFVGSQLLLPMPILAIAGVVAAVEAISNGNQPSRLLAIAGLGTLVVFVLVSLRSKVEANWPALAWPPLILLVVLRADQAHHHLWIRRGVVLAAIASLLLHLPPAVITGIGFRGQIRQLDGWDELAKSVEHQSGNLPIVATRYQDASLLAFYLPGRPSVSVLRKPEARRSQFDLWDPPADGRCVLVTSRSDEENSTRPFMHADNDYELKLGEITLVHEQVDPATSRRRYLCNAVIRSGDASPHARYINAPQQ